MAIKRSVVVQTSDDGRRGASEETDIRDLGLLAGAKILSISDTAFTLKDEHHGKIIDFVAATAVTVTIPNDLRIDFFCGISQGGAGQVTVSPGAGVDLKEANSQFKTAQRYVLLSLIAFTEDTFRLFDSTAA